MNQVPRWNRSRVLRRSRRRRHPGSFHPRHVRPDSPTPKDVPSASPPPETQTAPPAALAPVAIADPPAPTTPAVEPPAAADSVTEVGDATPRAQVETEPPLANTLGDREPDAGTPTRDTAVPDAPVNVPRSPNADAAIREVLATLERAIETKDMTLYRSVRPTLSVDEASRVRAGFEAVESQQVDLRILSIDVQGDQAVVRLSRRDTIQTRGGRQTQESNQTMTLAKMPQGWVITQMGV